MAAMRKRFGQTCRSSNLVTARHRGHGPLLLLSTRPAATTPAATSNYLGASSAPSTQLGLPNSARVNDNPSGKPWLRNSA